MLHILREKSANGKLDRRAFSAVMEKIGITEKELLEERATASEALGLKL
jgi:hypothetical protein